MPVIDATARFTCRHQFIGLGFAFMCVSCGHTRKEIVPIDQKRSLLFFPTARFILEYFDATDADMEQAYGIPPKNP